MEINKPEVYGGVLWASEAVGGRRRKQGWAEREIELQGILSGRLSQPMGSSEAGRSFRTVLAWAKGQGLQNHHINSSLDVGCPGKVAVLSVETLFNRSNICRGLTLECCLPTAPLVVVDWVPHS